VVRARLGAQSERFSHVRVSSTRGRCCSCSRRPASSEAAFCRI